MLEIREKVPLAAYTTLRVGGPARWFAEVSSEEELFEALRWADARGADVFLLGGGSNVLISDVGFNGLVVHMNVRGLQVDDSEFTVAAGEGWDEFVGQTVTRGFGGIECLSGIPGTCGAAPIQNIGAYGQEVAETIVAVRCYDRRERSVVTLSNAECGFAYRRSIFNSTELGRYIVLAVTFALTGEVAPAVRYADLQRYFAENPNPTLQQVRDGVIAVRASKGMVIREEDADSRSAGSFFKNPIITTMKYEGMKSKLAGCAVFPAGDGKVKLSAAWLIEHAGFARGTTEGNVGISSKHTLALVNRGGATAEELLAFARRVQDAVEERFEVRLNPEPVMVGFGVLAC